jgi:uncharacterized protein DUF3658
MDAPDPPLDVEQSLRVSRLTQRELQEIDRVLLANAVRDWRKVARLVLGATRELSTHIPAVPDVYYAQRVRNLVELGRLESQGDLAFMNRGEVRLPPGSQPSPTPVP